MGGRALKTQVVEITVPAIEGPVYAPVGVSSPQGTSLGCDVIGGQVRRFEELTSGQDLVCVTADADEITFRYAYSDEAGAYPDRMFQPAPSRHTRAAPELAEDARALAGDGDELTRAIRIARGVAEKFVYGHPEVKFYDGLDHVPLLSCGLTEGSCIDIHTYLLAAFRSVGIEAGYLTGYFFAEDGGPCPGGHCWTATRIGGETQEWDISHFLQIDRRDVGPALNPKGGIRFPVAHSMGLHLPGVEEVKLLVEPGYAKDGTLHRFATKRITLQAAPLPVSYARTA
jgi:transglutaminase-like putative cysteine protease